MIASVARKLRSLYVCASICPFSVFVCPVPSAVVLLYQCHLSGRGFGVLSVVVSGDFMTCRCEGVGAAAASKRVGMIIRDWELTPVQPHEIRRYGQAKESR